VIPTRNRVALVSRLLEQLIRIDDGLRYEVIVVDEGSSDATPEVLADYAERHGVRVFRHDVPLGLSGARNAGLDAATAPYVGWIDDDDLTSTDRLRRQREAVTATGARWSCAARVDIDDSLAVVGHVRCPPLDGFEADLLRSNTLPSAGQGLLVERALAVSVGAYDEALSSSEDWDFCIRLAAVSDPHLLDEPLVGYRVGVPSMSTNTERMERTIRAVIAKYPERYAALGVAPDWHAIHFGLLAAELTGSRRRAAARAGRAFLARPSPQAAVRAVAIAGAPQWYAGHARRRRIAEVPDEWAETARQWLGAVPSTS